MTKIKSYLTNRHLVCPLDQVVGVERAVVAAAEDPVDGGRRRTRRNLGELRRRRQTDGRHGRRVLLHRVLELLVDGQLQVQLVRVDGGQDLLIAGKNFGLQRRGRHLQGLGLRQGLGLVAEVENRGRGQRDGGGQRLRLERGWWGCGAAGAAGA